MTTPITPPLTPPQLAVLQKPSEGAPPAEPHLPSTARGGSAAPPQSNGTGRGRLLDIVV